jgi:hypothetical protein
VTNEEMVDPNEKTAEPGERGSFLMMVLGATLSNALSLMGLLPGAESILVGWMVAFLVGYWIPPRPQVRFIPWMLRRFVLLLFLCLAVFLIPSLLKPAMPSPLAYGIPFVAFVGAVIAWVRHRKRPF